MENKNWITHVEWVVMMITAIGGFYMIDGKIERQADKLDRTIEIFQSKTDQMCVRTDRLYDMFIESIKEGRK
jgi:hypothetical protein